MKKQSGKNNFVINEEFIFDQDKYNQGLNNRFNIGESDETQIAVVV